MISSYASMRSISIFPTLALFFCFVLFFIFSNPPQHVGSWLSKLGLNWVVLRHWCLEHRIFKMKVHHSYISIIKPICSSRSVDAGHACYTWPPMKFRCCCVDVLTIHRVFTSLSRLLILCKDVTLLSLH